MMLKIVDATPRHMRELQRHMREADRAEVIGMSGDLDQAMRVTWNESMMTKAAILDGKVAAVWGVGGTALGGVGRPWMLTTPAFERLKFKAVRTAYSEVSKWLAIFPRLENHVDAAYRGACRFLEVLGFRLGEPTRLPSGMMVRMFWMERG